ncbi:MAG: chemotaxis protein CheC [Lachnospiraceae bacterium]|nr:chemotaxis protein CheC [Lachnospiraceae bacterium]
MSNDKVEFTQMDAMHYDVLREICNIGAGNATTALAKMLNVKVDMQVPKVDLVDFKNLADVVGGAETVDVGILLMLEGNVEGMMMFILEKDTAQKMVRMLMGMPLDDLGEFSEMELSALQEVGNIITGAYLSALSDLTKMYINASIPYLAIDMVGAILSVPAIEFGKIGDKALLIQTEFGEKDTNVNGYFILIPTPDSYDTIFKSLGLL